MSGGHSNVVDTLQEFEHARLLVRARMVLSLPVPPSVDKNDENGDKEGNALADELRETLGQVQEDNKSLEEALREANVKIDKLEKLVASREAAMKEAEADAERAGKRAATAEKIAVETKAKMQHLVANLPPSTWEVCRTETGDVYYFNTVTKESSWEAPPNCACETSCRGEKTKETATRRRAASRRTSSMLFAQMTSNP